jgi:heme a synthase
MKSVHGSSVMISQWLFVCLLLIFVMVILGGVTRLTGSGLSMVNWHPIHGVLPPIGDVEWQREFESYQQYPEYQKINRHFDLSEFKSIFWFEYSHRMLGRLIGLVFFIPLVVFWIRREIPDGMKPRFVILLILGGLQGVLGWYMVKSGLVNNPHVSQYRLTAHLLAAVLIFGYILWTILDLRSREKVTDSPNNSYWTKISLILTGMVVLTMVSGGFVAGLKAGLFYNTFPLMGGQWIPEGVGALSPRYMNIFENKVTVQFNHRILALLTALLLIIWYIKGRRFFPAGDRLKSFKLIGMMTIIQVALGISTLLLQVPVVLGAMHQAGGLLLFSALLFNLHSLKSG